jgi:hypothetical protein
MRTILFAAIVAGLLAGTHAGAADPSTEPTSQPGDRLLVPPLAPNMVLLYYGFDPRGPRDWTPEHLKHYLGFHENRGTAAERPSDTFFDTVLWMYRKSSRGHLFEAGSEATPTTRCDWQESLDRLFLPGLQLFALEEGAATLERQLGRPVHVWVVLTLPYPDVRVSNWNDVADQPAWDFRRSDDQRFRAVQWYVQSALKKWSGAHLGHLHLLGFYWFNESHINLRKQDNVADRGLLSDVGLMRSTARYLHGLKVDGHRLTLTWIPYSPYGGDRLSVTADSLSGAPDERVDYLMVQPNYFFPRWKKQKAELVQLVLNASSIPCGVEIECDELLIRDEAARERYLDYLNVIPQEHAHWTQVPAGYYQGVRAVHEMATRPELDSLYDALYEFVVARRTADARMPESVKGP